MLTSQQKYLSDGRVIKFELEMDSSPISYATVIQQWQEDSNFREFFIDVLLSSPFSAFRWETPPITKANANQAFEFVLVNSPDIVRCPDSTAFDREFSNYHPGEIAQFVNLGGDAMLLAPCPEKSASDFGHLATFLRASSRSQRHLLWESVGSAMQYRVGEKPVWLNTAGGGVPWLHVRLDDQPKYYAYTPYRHAKC